MKIEVSVDERCVGSILAEPIFAKNGAKVIAEGVCLNQKTIEKLMSMGISTVIIGGEEGNFKIEEGYDLTKEVSLKLKNDLLKEIEVNFESVKNDKLMNVVQIKRLVTLLAEEVYRSKPVKAFSRMSSVKNSLPIHSVNVALISLFTAREMGYSFDKAYQITMGALLHDIGMIIDPESHCEKALVHLRKYSELSAMIYLPAYQHHPDKVKMPIGAPLHDFSKIVIASDMFDKLSASGQFTQQEVVKKMISAIGGSYDKQCVVAMLKGTAKLN